MKKETEKLWKQALYELDVALTLLKKYKYAASSFHSQQAVEMGLKALFFEEKEEIYYDHKLYELAAKLNIPKDIYNLCSNLNPVYQESRYFDARVDDKIPSEQYNEDNAKEYYNNAEDILKWTAKKLKISLD